MNMYTECKVGLCCTERVGLAHFWRSLVSIVTASGILYGCANVQPIAPQAYRAPVISTEHRVDRSYELNTPLEAYVGEQILRVQDYYVTVRRPETNKTSLVPSEPFLLTLPPFASVSLSQHDVVAIVGTTERSGKTYRVVALPKDVARLLRFLINDDGSFEGSAINHFGERMGWTYSPIPASVRLVSETVDVQTDYTKSFKNYELVYGGRSKDSFQLLYREYTKDDLARPAFSQSLMYDSSQGSIRFRNLQIEVYEASNQKIRFSVISEHR